MQKLIPIFILFLTFVSCTSSDKKEQAQMSENELRSVFNKDMSSYLRLINEGDFNKAFDYLPEAIFKIASKEELLQTYESLEEKGMRMEMEILKITDISKVKTKDNSNYCRFNYEGTIVIHLSGMMLEMKDMLADQFEAQYEKSNATIYDDRIELNLEQTVFAVSIEGASDWKYAEYNESSKQAMSHVIPSDVIAELL